MEVKLETVFWEATKLCNQKCIHCSNSSGEELSNELSTDEITNAIDTLIELGLVEFKFYGGEPLMRKDLFDVAIYLRSKSPNVFLSLYTNATIMNDTILAKLTETKFDKLFLSIHDSRPEVHDRISNSNKSLEKVIRTANIVKDFTTGANYTISKYNLDNIWDTFRFAKEVLHVDTIHVSLLTQVGRATNHPDMYLTAEDIVSVAKDTSSAYAHFFGEQRARYCEAGVHRIMISAEGNIYPCPLFIEPRFLAGNIRKRPFIDIWNSPKLGFQKVRDVILDGNINSGCRSRAFFLVGGI